MKVYKYINILLSTFLFLMTISCEIEEITEDIADSGMVHKRFTAVIEGGEVTKTLLDENVEDGVRDLLWDPGDVIGIGVQGSKFCKFTNVRTDASADGVFEGSISEANSYFAVYPWQGNLTMTTELTLEIPSRQTYRENSFDIDVAPMVGRGNNGESIYFQNLCGVLAIPMTGSDMISWIILTAKDSKGNPAFISGDFSVDMGYEDFPYPMPVESSQTKIILDCGSGVQLDSEAETYFHIVLPPGKYYGLDLLIVTSDGKFMTKSTENTLTLRRSMITKTAVLEYQENVGAEVITDLSLRGNANCYIVPSEGFYSFDASTIGNGTFGLVKGAGFHTDDVKISPVSAEILWSVPDNVIEVLSFDKSNCRVQFTASGVEGNALVAVKDADGTILWSWHIWVTDTPIDQNYINSAGIFDVQDRNLGATRADRGTGDEWVDAIGLLYQWGRKEPLAVVFDGVNIKQELFYMEPSQQSLVDNAIKNPTGFYRYWDNDINLNLWQNIQKTIYDPCPVGYRVVDRAAWSGFAIDGATSYDHGWDILYDGQNRSYYPMTHYVTSSGKLSYYYTDRSTSGCIWSSCHRDGFDACVLLYGPSLFISTGYDFSCGCPVRCMKDENHVDISLPLVEIIGVEEITPSSAKVLLNITSEGISSVTAKGVVYGTTPDLADGIKVECYDGNVAELTGLSNAVKYYVKPYAINGRGESLGSLKSFRTTYSDDVIDLSKAGTANCYIIQPLPSVRYSFDCTIKGNSSETIETPASLEVLWEVNGSSSTAESGTIISSIEIINNEVALLELPCELKEGNALIAAKDQSGTILWSWHFWVTDKPVEQTYVNTLGEFKVLDRHLGATRADRGVNDEWEDSMGLAYFWGRKDPFWYEAWQWSSVPLTLNLSIENPTKRWYDGAQYWLKDDDVHSLWSDKHKTKYDPCPVGYRVATIDIWYDIVDEDYSIEQKVNGEWDHGFNIYIDDTQMVTSWYPQNVEFIGKDAPYVYCSPARIWSSSPSPSSSMKEILQFSESRISLSSNVAGMGFPVRCMKE